MKTYFYILFILVFTACSKKNPIEKTLIANSDEYWTYYNSASNTVTYFRFKDDQLSYQYYKDRDSTQFIEFSNKNMNPIQKWSVTKDSIMTWNEFNYDVVSYNDKVIVLLALTKEEPFANYIFLIKEDKKPREGPADFEEKRRFNPEKYPFVK